MSIPQSKQLTSTLTVISNVPCELEGLWSVNEAAAESFIQFFDSASATGITVGTTAPLFWIPLPASGGGVAPLPIALKIPFTKGIVVCSTTTPTGASTASVDAVFWAQ